MSPSFRLDVKKKILLQKFTCATVVYSVKFTNANFGVRDEQNWTDILLCSV